MAEEQIVLDPSELAGTARPELNITTGAVWVTADGVDWGEAAISAFMAERNRGEVPTGFRMPNRRVEMNLRLQTFGSTSFTEARGSIQEKVALIQQEGGYMRRVLSTGGTVYLELVNATLDLPGSWMQAHQEIEPEAHVTFEALPDFFGAEINGSAQAETTNAELIWTEADVKGDYASRCRITIENNEDQDQRALIWAFRYADTASTSQMAYGAQSLTPLDSAANATIGGRAAVQHTAVGSGWTPLLSTNLTAGTYLTHSGRYRLYADVYSTAGTDIQARLVWGIGDLVGANENPTRELPGASDYFILDLGEMDLSAGPIPPHRWQGKIQVRSLTAGVAVAIARLWIIPCDQGFGFVRAPLTLQRSLPNVELRDEFDQTTGDANGKSLPLPAGASWADSGAPSAGYTINADDHRLIRARPDVEDASAKFLTASAPATLAELTLEGDVYVDTHVVEEYVADVWGHEVGYVVRYVDTSNYLLIRIRYTQADETFGSGDWAWTARVDAGAVEVVKVVAGTPTTLFTSGTKRSLGGPRTWWTFRIHIGVNGYWEAYYGPPGASSPEPAGHGYDAVLATGGALQNGKVGAYNLNAERRGGGVWDNLTVYGATPAGEASREAVIFAGRQMSLRTDGAWHQDPSGTVWGIAPSAEIALPRMPAGHGRNIQCFLKCSRGDLGEIANSGVDDLGATLYYRPSWLFIPG